MSLKTPAKHFFTVISEIRTGQFAAAGMGLLRRTDESIFDASPADVGHFGRPYYDHVLRGLRRSPPEYVTDLVLQPDDRQMSDGIDGVDGIDPIDGIVVVHL